MEDNMTISLFLHELLDCLQKKIPTTAWKEKNKVKETKRGTFVINVNLLTPYYELEKCFLIFNLILELLFYMT
jgi:hypothetical protein